MLLQYQPSLLLSREQEGKGNTSLKNMSPLSLASHWLELIYIDWETGKCSFYFGAAKYLTSKKGMGILLLEEKGEMDRE